MRSIRARNAAVAVSIVLIGLSGATAATAAPAQARSGPTWTTSFAPTPTEPNDTVTGMSCSSARWCMEVGHGTRPNGLDRPMAARYTGNRWVSTPMPVPANVAVIAGASLSCSGPQRCLAIYRAYTYGGTLSGDQMWLVESWNGTKWRLNTHPPLSTDDFVTGITCADASRCLVVINGTTQARLWTPSGWQQETLPAGMSPTLGLAAACGAKDNCVLVGANATRHRLTVARWNGTSFTTPQVTAIHSDIHIGIGSVSCRTPQACVVAGATYTQSRSYPFVAHWNGKHWTEVPVPPVLPVSSLYQASCTEGYGCFFLGVQNLYSGSRLVVLHKVRSTWTEKKRPLDALQCTGRRFCVVAAPKGLGWSAQIWTGDSWRAEPVPTPPGYRSTEITAMSCTSPDCVAVGNSEGSGVFYRHTARGWQLQQVTPLPGRFPSITDVSCGAPQDCWAVGETSDNPLLYRYAGHSWTRHPVSRGNTEITDLTAISCVSRSFCMAVPKWGGNGTESWNGSRWSAHHIPIDFDASDISCASKTSCIVVGQRGNAQNGMRWNGRTWTATDGPSLDNVSCVSARFCMAVGAADSGNDPDTVAVWRGRAWHTLTYPKPAPGWQLAGVSCTSSESCTIVGTRWTGQSAFQTSGFSETWNGSTWTVRQARNRHGYVDTFDGVECSASGPCRSFGSAAGGAPVPIIATLRG